MAGGGIRCSVGSCKSQQKKNKDLSFFSFPKDVQIQREWINRCGRIDKINVRNARICSLHFLPSDFERNLKAELLDVPCRKKLKTQAIPSLLLSVDVKPNVSSREERALKKQRREIVATVLQKSAATSPCESGTSNEESQVSILVTERDNIITGLQNEIDFLKKENSDLKLQLENSALEKANIIKQYQSEIEILKAASSKTAKKIKRIVN